MSERRANRDAVQLKCPSCSHVNEAGYKFCGHCGTRVDRRLHERRGSGTEVRATAGANASLPTPDDARRSGLGSNVALSGERELIDRELIGQPGSSNAGIFVNDQRVSDVRRDAATREELTGEMLNERLRGNDRRGDGRNNEALRDELAREEMRRDMALRSDLTQPPLRERPLRDVPPLRRENKLEGSEPRIMGPSFLGIGNDPEGEGEYLLEDESGSGAGIRRLILLVVLAAIVGLIFMQYRSSLKANPKTPELSPSAAPGRGSATSPSGTTPGRNSSDPKAFDNSGTYSGTVSADSSKKAVDADSAKDPAKKDQADVDEPGILPNAADRNPAEAGSAATASKTTEMTKPDSSGSAGDATKGSDSTGASSTTPSAAGAKPSAVVDTAAVDPAVNAKPSATLVRAQQFLQGRGVPQNCEQGLVYLRVAAQKNEPAAAVQMGALYAAGHCVKQDRVMAYRWFNSAHELQPGNQWIQKSMDQLWSQMNEQERRLSGY